MINKPLTTTSEDIDRDCAAYVLTLLRVMEGEPGMDHLLSTFHTRFTPDQYEVVERLGGELAVMLRLVAYFQGLDPREFFDSVYYPNIDWMPVDDVLVEEK